MKAVILAGGLGTRLSEETSVRPKPMVEIGSQPILWHIMKIYSCHGINDFIICCGYKGYVIKEYFSNYFLHTSDVTFDLSQNQIEIHRRRSEDWRVTLVDTGGETMTGGRIARVKDYLDDTEPFCLTYGDGVANVDISKLVQFHKQHTRLATVTTTSPPGRFGAVTTDAGLVTSFHEKPMGDGQLINCGFFVLEKPVLETISGDDCVWEQEPLRELVGKQQLMSFEHSGFWQPMDTLRDKILLEKLWAENCAPWKVW